MMIFRKSFMLCLIMFLLNSCWSDYSNDTKPGDIIYFSDKDSCQDIFALPVLSYQHSKEISVDSARKLLLTSNFELLTSIENGNDPVLNSARCYGLLNTGETSLCLAQLKNICTSKLIYWSDSAAYLWKESEKMEGITKWVFYMLARKINLDLSTINVSQLSWPDETTTQLNTLIKCYGEFDFQLRADFFDSSFIDTLDTYIRNNPGQLEFKLMKSEVILNCLNDTLAYAEYVNSLGTLDFLRVNYVNHRNIYGKFNEREIDRSDFSVPKGIGELNFFYLSYLNGKNSGLIGEFDGLDFLNFVKGNFDSNDYGTLEGWLRIGDNSAVILNKLLQLRSNRLYQLLGDNRKQEVLQLTEVLDHLK